MKFRFLREASWSQQKIVSLCLCFSLVLLTACGKQGGVPASAPITAKSEAVSAQPAVDSEGNAVLETAETLGPDFDDAITQEPIEEDATVAGSLSGSLVEVGSKVG